MLNDYSNEGESSNYDREKAAKRETTELIKKQFELRRNSQEVSQETIDKLYAKNARVKAAASTTTKVKGLTLANREQYLNKLRDLLYENYTTAREEEEECYFDKKDMEDCAIDLEYEVFTSNTTIMMYRNCIARLV